ncbi:MAG: hypothetical protein LBK27_02330 [Treponema sp.]|jgi:hypothetical protein|nr:hypothetical protein [Treponema sp.]
MKKIHLLCRKTGNQFAVTGMVMVMLFASCATEPYTVFVAAGDTVNNKSATMLGIGITEQQLAYIPLVDAGIYNTVLAENKDALMLVQAEKNKALFDDLRAIFIRNHNMRIVESSYPFEEEETEAGFFRKPSDENVKQQIAEIGQENDTDYVITAMTQFVTTGVSTFGITGGNLLKLEICIFDRDGNLLGSGTASSDFLSLKANDVYGFGNLYNSVLGPAEQLIAALGK